MFANSITKRGSQFLYSLFKKKVKYLQIKQYTNQEHLYDELLNFEKGLEHIELKKMPKKLEDFSKKFKKLIRSSNQNLIPINLSLTHTYLHYCIVVDEILFGKQQNPKEASIQQLLNLTNNMVLYDLNNYYQLLLPQASLHQQLYLQLSQRFKIIQERISRFIFKGYYLFSKSVSKISFLDERQYKGDYKFCIVDYSLQLQKLIDCLYNCALFNKLSDKLTLAAELTVNHHLEHLNPDSLRKLIFCLAISGKPLKFIEKNYYIIKEKIITYPIELLFYLKMANMSDSFLMQQIYKNVIFEPINYPEFLISRTLVELIKIQDHLELQIKPKFQIEYKSQPILDSTIFFQDFLKRFNYKYQIKQNSIFGQIFQIDSKHFVCMNNGEVKDNFELNGLGLMSRQWLIATYQSAKHINWPRMINMQKRGQKQEYILSKFKGIQKPKKEKVRYYQ